MPHKQKTIQMDEKIVISPEEQTADLEAQQEAKVEEVRESVIAEYGFDEVDDSERIDKLVAEKLEHRKVLSQAIGQKVKYRTALQASATPPPKETPKANPTENLDEEFNKRFEQRDLESLDYPDDLKTEVQKLAKVQGISVKKAALDPYIQFKKQEYDKAQKADEAAISRTHKSTGGKVAFSTSEPPEVDMASDDGRKKWDEYLGWLKTQPGYRDSDSQL